MECISLREELIEYIKKKYNDEKEYLWARHPNYVVFRHEDNRKWYSLIMDVPKTSLGLEGEGRTDILNVKLDDLLLRDFLIQQEGYFRGYHISRGNWISILLDGTVPFSDACKWIDTSYQVTASAAGKKKLRLPKEWLVPANPKYYDIEGSFAKSDIIDWKQGRGIKTGDTAFMYIAAPVSAVLYKCKVVETDIPFHFADKNISMDAIMRIQLQKRYSPDAFPFEKLKREYGIYAVRAPRGVPYSLSEAFKKLDEPDS